MASPFEVHDPAFSRLVPVDQEIERIATGFAFTEGPVWDGASLLFSDIPNNRIVRWRQLPEGPEVTTFRCPSGFPLGQPTKVGQMGSNGLTLDRQGGAIFSTDPPYGLFERTEGKELEFQGVYRIDPDGSLHLAVDDFERPNGL